MGILPFPSFPIRRSLRILHPSPPLASPSQAFTSTKPQPTPPVARYTAPAVMGTSRPHAARTALHRLECSVHSLSRPQHTEPTQNTQTGEESPFWQHSTEHKTKQLKQQLWAIVENVTLASPLADAEYAHMASSSRIDGLLGTLSELSGWTIALTLLALMVAYDQCSYLWQKGSIPG